MSGSKEWLKSVKAGDSVFYINGYMGNIASAEVAKVTATQIVCGPRRFNRETGYMIGVQSYHRPRLIESTQEIKDRVRADEVFASLSNLLRGKGHSTVALLLYLGAALEAYESKHALDRKDGTE